MIGWILASLLVTTQDSPRSDPSIAVYGGVPIDLDVRKERSAGRNWYLNDCSTETLQCVEGHYYRLAVPRLCDGWHVGERFEAGAVKTDVLWTRPAGARAVDKFWPGEVRILGNPDQRWSVYVYVGPTLEAIYVDPLRKGDLYQLAKDGGLEALIPAGGEPDRYLLPLETIRGLFSCHYGSEADDT